MALDVILINNNTWTNPITGGHYEQNNYLLVNNGTRNVCDVVMIAPVSREEFPAGNTSSPPFLSSYVVESSGITDGEMELTLPSLAATVFGYGHVIAFGYILEGDWDGSITRGPVFVADARFCEGKETRLRGRSLVGGRSV